MHRSLKEKWVMTWGSVCVCVCVCDSKSTVCANEHVCMCMCISICICRCMVCIILLTSSVWKCVDTYICVWHVCTSTSYCLCVWLCTCACVYVSTRVFMCVCESMKLSLCGVLAPGAGLLCLASSLELSEASSNGHIILPPNPLLPSFQSLALSQWAPHWLLRAPASADIIQQCTTAAGELNSRELSWKVSSSSPSLRLQRFKTSRMVYEGRK